MTEKDMKIVKTCILAGAESLKRRNPYKPGLVGRTAWENVCQQIPHEITKYLWDYFYNMTSES